MRDYQIVTRLLQHCYIQFVASCLACFKLVVNLKPAVRRQLVDRIVTRCALLGVCCKSYHSSHNVTLSTFPVGGNWSTWRKPTTLDRAVDFYSSHEDLVTTVIQSHFVLGITQVCTGGELIPTRCVW